MKQCITTLVFAITLFLPLLAQEKPLAEHQEFTSNTHLLESWIKAQMDYRGLPGMSLGIVYDQELVYARGFGYSDLEQKTPATPQTIYRIASITKTFTSTALMQLRDAGKLGLDDPITQYLPWFKIQNRHPDAPAITIRHLITHTSGLPREAAFPYWTDHKFPTREEMIAALANQETIYAPETEYKYSNLALALAGEVVAAASGMAYDQYIEKNILAPLGMTRSSVFLSADEKRGLATPYSRRLDDGSHKVMPFTDSKGIAPAANMSSTVEDLARYLALQFREGPQGGSQILKGSTLREMHRVHWLQPSWRSGRGLGFSVWQMDEHTVVGHGGWVAGNRTQIAFIPKRKVGVIVLTNADDGDPWFYADKVLKMFLPVLAKLTAPETPVAQANPAWQQYVGMYSDPWWFDTEVLIFNNKLMMNGYSFPPESDPAGELVELVPEGEHTFRMSGQNGNGELVVFEMDSQGKVTRVKVGENYIYPKAN